MSNNQKEVERGVFVNGMMFILPHPNGHLNCCIGYDQQSVRKSVIENAKEWIDVDEK